MYTSWYSDKLPRTSHCPSYTYILQNTSLQFYPETPQLMLSHHDYPHHWYQLTIWHINSNLPAPSPPRMLTMIGEPNGSTIELNWLPPLHPNGAIHYEIEYEPAVTPGDPVNAGNSNSTYFTLTLPIEFLTYNVRVAAVNTQGQAQSSDITVCPGMNRQSGMCAGYSLLYSQI